MQVTFELCQFWSRHVLTEIYIKMSMTSAGTVVIALTESTEIYLILKVSKRCFERKKHYFLSKLISGKKKNKQML